jgi:ribosomal protein L40E
MAARNQLNQAAQDEAALVSAMWAESAQRVMDKGSARVCYRCALPLSMHARYCRRCGTNQQG